MTVTIDKDNVPYVHIYGTMAEVLAALKGYSRTSVIMVGYNGTNISAVVYKSVTPS